LFSFPALGIDLGDGALKAVRMKRRGARLVVTWAAYRPYARAEDGAVRPTAGLESRAAAALRQFLEEQQLSAMERVIVGFPSVATFNRLITVPDVGDERLDEIARYEAHRSLRGPIDDYVVRTRVLRRHGSAEEIPCMLYAVRRRIRDAFVSDLSRAGLEFDNLVPAPAALALFVNYDRPAKGQRIAVSIGLRATEVVYLRDQGYAFRTLPLGVVGLSSLTTEEQKRQAAARLAERLSAEIGFGATFFFGGHGAFRPDTVMLFGEGAVIPEVVSAFKRLYPTRVEGIGNLHRVLVDARMDAETRARVGQMGSALGLAIAASRTTEREIELLPRNGSRAALRRLPALAAAAILVSGVAGMLTWRDVAQNRSLDAVAVTPSADAVRERTALESRLVTRLENLQEREQQLATLVAGRAARASLLARLLSQFGPEVTDYGETDLRLFELTISHAANGATIAGEVTAPMLDSRASTVLRQRLAAIHGVSDISVEAVPARDDAFIERARFAFRATLSWGLAS